MVNELTVQLIGETFFLESEGLIACFFLVCSLSFSCISQNIFSKAFDTVKHCEIVLPKLYRTFPFVYRKWKFK